MVVIMACWQLFKLWVHHTAPWLSSSQLRQQQLPTLTLTSTALGSGIRLLRLRYLLADTADASSSMLSRNTNICFRMVLFLLQDVCLLL